MTSAAGPDGARPTPSESNGRPSESNGRPSATTDAGTTQSTLGDTVELAAALTHQPSALLGLLGPEQEWTSWARGLDAAATALAEGFGQLLREELDASGADVLEVPDARNDKRFALHALVTGTAEVRSFTAVALREETGAVTGVLCVLGRHPQQLSPEQRQHVTVTARVIAQLRHRSTGPREADQRREDWSFNTQFLKGILAASPAAIYAKDADGRFLMANRTLHDLLGRRDGSLLGMSNWDAFPGLIADQFHRNDREVVAAGEASTFSEMLTHSDGRVHEYVTTKFPLVDEDGAVYAIGGVSTEVGVVESQPPSQSHSSAQAHSSSQSHSSSPAQPRSRTAGGEEADVWYQIIERSPAALVTIADDGTITYANTAAELLCAQVLPSPVTGRAIEEYLPLETRGALGELLHSVLAGQRIVDEPWTLQRRDGSRVQVEISAVTIVDGTGPAVLATLRDIQARSVATDELRSSQVRWRAMFDASPVGIGLSDEHGKFVTVNAALCLLLGRTEAQILGHSSAEFTHPDDLDSHRSASRLINDSASGYVRIEKRYVRPDGTVRWAWLTVTHTDGPAGQTWTLAHVQDVTDRISVEQAVRDSEDNLSLVAAVVHDIQSGADARHSIVQAGQAMAEAAVVSLVEPGLDPEELTVTASTFTHLTGTSVRLRSASVTADVYTSGKPQFIGDAATHERVSAELLRLTRARSLFVVPVRSAGETHAVLLVAWDRVIETLEDKRIAAVTLLADQTGVALRQAALLTELSQLAMTDSLTGALNRRAWDQRLDQLLNRAHRTGHPLTIAIADLDHFKRFNDTYGHPAGDKLLVEFAAAVTGQLRADDTLARWGGEEFAIALPECSAEHAMAVLQHVQGVVPYEQTISIGFATYDSHSGETAAELTERADRALYYGKTHGRNQVHAAPPASAETPAAS